MARKRSVRRDAVRTRRRGPPLPCDRHVSRTAARRRVRRLDRGRARAARVALRDRACAFAGRDRGRSRRRLHRRSPCARLILDRNPYNEDAWTALIDHDLRCGSVSGARAKSTRAAAAFGEAGLTLSDAFRGRYAKLLENTATPASIPFIGRAAESERILRASATRAPPAAWPSWARRHREDRAAA